MTAGIGKHWHKTQLIGNKKKVCHLEFLMKNWQYPQNFGIAQLDVNWNIEHKQN